MPDDLDGARALAFAIAALHLLASHRIDLARDLAIGVERLELVGKADIQAIARGRADVVHLAIGPVQLGGGAIAVGVLDAAARDVEHAVGARDHVAFGPDRDRTASGAALAYGSTHLSQITRHVGQRGALADVDGDGLAAQESIALQWCITQFVAAQLHVDEIALHRHANVDHTADIDAAALADIDPDAVDGRQTRVLEHLPLLRHDAHVAAGRDDRGTVFETDVATRDVDQRMGETLAVLRGGLVGKIRRDFGHAAGAEHHGAGALALQLLNPIDIDRLGRAVLDGGIAADDADRPIEVHRRGGTHAAGLVHGQGGESDVAALGDDLAQAIDLALRIVGDRAADVHASAAGVIADERIHLDQEAPQRRVGRRGQIYLGPRGQDGLALRRADHPLVHDVGREHDHATVGLAHQLRTREYLDQAIAKLLRRAAPREGRLAQGERQHPAVEGVVGNVQGRGVQRLHVELRAVLEQDAIAVDQHDLAVGADRAGDGARVRVPDAVERRPTGVAVLVEHHALAALEIELLPVEDRPRLGLLDGQQVGVGVSRVDVRVGPLDRAVGNEPGRLIRERRQRQHRDQRGAGCGGDAAPGTGSLALRTRGFGYGHQRGDAAVEDETMAVCIHSSGLRNRRRRGN